jgi:hypothetical protein
MRRVLAFVVAAGLALVCAPPAVADPEPYVDLVVLPELDQPAYFPTDTVTLQLRVINSGTAPATGVVIRSTGDLEFGPWGKLDAAGPGIDLPPDGQAAITVTAPAKEAGDMAQLIEAVSAEPDANPADNQRSLAAFVTAEKVGLTLTVHLDGNDNGVIDTGETTNGISVTLRGGRMPWQGTARTDANGAISFPELPGGEYNPDISLPTGWYLDPALHVQLRPGHNEIVVRARHIDLTKLTASITFDKPVYAVGDTIRERVTLTNTGDEDLAGFVARCGNLSIQSIPGSDRNELTSVGWGELDPNGVGATLRAGETRTWEFTATVVPIMWEFGFVTIDCDFIVPGMLTGPHAKARADVPGGAGTVGGVVYHEDVPKPGITFLLINQATGAIAGRVTSDAAGRIDFPALPADSYELRPLGPWRLMDKVYGVQIRAGSHLELALALVPGPVQLDPEIPAPSPKQKEDVPTPQASPVRHPGNLADTGADVVELLALGALLVVVGLVLVRRRSYS